VKVVALKIILARPSLGEETFALTFGLASQHNVEKRGHPTEKRGHPRMALP
jgi:hypothetical protein